MKPLQPSMRDKTRYLEVQIHSDQDITLSQMVDNFWQSSIQYMGVNNLSEANPWVIANKFDQKNQKAVIRARRDYIDDIRASLIMIGEIENQSLFLSVEKVSGSISNID